MPFSIFEVLIVVGLLVLLFGAKGAPKIARRLGTGLREMKDAVSEMDPRSVFDADEKPKAAPALEAPRTDPAEVAPVAQAHDVIDAELAVPVERLSTDDPSRPSAAS